jgi:hypothetical protein
MHFGPCFVATDGGTVVVAIYIDSWIFVFATAIIQFGFGVDFSFPVCDSAILLCLLCYISSKVCHYISTKPATHNRCDDS